MIYIKELFDSPVSYKQIDNFSWSFYINESYYYVVKLIVGVYDSYTRYEILNLLSLTDLSYDINDRNALKLKYIKNETKQLMFELSAYNNKSFPSDRKYQLTGTGQQFTILSTVIDIFKKEIIPNFRLPILIFSAREKSRQKVYDLLIKKFAGISPDLKYFHHFNIGKQKIYLFINKDEIMEDLLEMTERK